MIRSGSICISFLYNYLTSSNNTEGNDRVTKNHQKLKCLSDTFASYGGVLAKLSQILCFEDGKGDVFSDCKPYCQKETIEHFKEEYINNRELFKNVIEVNFDVFKSGSVGQIHKAIYKDDEIGEEKNIIIKVQYVGLYEQFKNDISILDKVASFVFYFSDLTSAMTDIKTKLYEELDYSNEFKNQQHICDLWEDHPNIKIPELIPELCTDTLLGMEFIDAESFFSFNDTSTQDEKNKIGMLLIEFIFTNFYKHGIFYSDIHYGNFLIQDKNKLYVTDFGCLNYVDTELLNNFKILHKAIYDDDHDLFYDYIEKIGIINDEISDDSRNYIYEYFKIQYEPFVTKGEFEFNEEWLSKSVHKKPELMKEWALPSNCVYLNKIPYGMYHLLTKLNLKGEITDLMKTIIDLD